VTRCRSAAYALIVLAQNTFDLVLLDQRLPDMPGLELLNILARDGIAVPALMVTAHGDEQLATRVLHAGALDYIVKDPALTFLTELPKRVSESVTRHRLEQMNRLLIQALESARDGIMITDLHGTILEVNQALEQLTGYSRRELLGQNPRLLKSGVHPPALYADLWRTILARGSWQGEVTNRRKDGSLFQSSMSVSPIVDSQGRLTHFVGIQRDITQHRRMEQQLIQAQKMQSVGTLAGGVAHEFNNLLAGINGYAALGLREPGLSPTLRQFLHCVVDLSERAAGLTRQLLAFARKPALVRQPTLMTELVRGTAELVARTLHHDVVTEVAEGADDGSPLLVAADANQVQQALVNLALNARDAIRERQAAEAGSPDPPSGSITFRLRQERTAGVFGENAALPQHVPPGDYVVLEVQDRGFGMNPEVLSQALDPFFTTKDVGQGTGPGLPVVFGIVQGHQGHLAIDSTPGQGTCVRIYLPRLVADARPDGCPAPGFPTSGTSAGKRPETVEPETVPSRVILVIDDEEAVLDVVRRFLEIVGHRVICAGSGRDALEVAAAQPLDLVILDLMMPREDAETIFRRLRQRCPGVPMLLCTGLPQADPAAELLRAGAAGVVRKPFRMNELWYAVRQALASSPASQATWLPGQVVGQVGLGE
jgi:PAS domain S-box-containing protein